MRNMRSGVIFAIDASEPDQSTANRSPAGSKAAPPCLTDAVNCAPKTGDPASTSGPHPTVPGYSDSNRRSRLGRKNCTNNGENETGRAVYKLRSLAKCNRSSPTVPIAQHPAKTFPAAHADEIQGRGRREILSWKECPPQRTRDTG